MLLHKLPSGDPVHRYLKSIVVLFGGKRRVLSTCPLNGGYREDLKAVFNNDGYSGKGFVFEMRAPTYEGHMALVAAEIGLDPGSCTGTTTAASMENVSIRSESYRDITVTAIVTAGIDINAGRVGDPAYWYEENGKSVSTKPGTINIILDINVDLTQGALARAMVTCTEAKAAALQELLVPSRYSMGIATGSGTDDTIIVCDAQSDICLSNAGKHSKLGELIGKAVKAAVKEALYRQTGMSPERQHHIFRRMDRFGITEQSLWDLFDGKELGMSRTEFSEKMQEFGSEDAIVTLTSLYAHLLDQLIWGMLSPAEAVNAGKVLLDMMKLRQQQQPQQEITQEDIPDYRDTAQDGKEAAEPYRDIPEDRDAALEQMIAMYAQNILEKIGVYQKV